MKSGIYMIHNKLDGKVYIGQAADIEKRKGQHFRALRRGDHRNIRMQRAFWRDGEDSFVFSVLESCTVEMLTEREQFWIDAHSYIYNICPAGGSSLGVKRSAETRAKQSVLKKTHSIAHLMTPEVRAKAAKTHKERWDEIHERIQSAETVAKRSASLKAKWALTPKKSPSEEARAKMSASAKARKANPPRSAEARARMSAAQYKRYASG